MNLIPKPVPQAVLRGLVFAAGLYVSSAMANWAVVDLLPGGTASPMATDGFIGLSYAGPTGIGELQVGLRGYGSLDGDNYYRDQFVMLRNGQAIFAGSFNLGGGGLDSIDFNPLSAAVSVTVDGVAGPFGATWSGGSADVTFNDFVLATGDTLTLGWSSLGGPYFGFQGLADESWGVDTLRFTTAVPEPGSLALWLVACAVGVLHRPARRRVPRVVRGA